MSTDAANYSIPCLSPAESELGVLNCLPAQRAAQLGRRVPQVCSNGLPQSRPRTSRRVSDLRPQIPVCMYHGTPAERAELRRTVMRPAGDDEEDQAPPTKKRKATQKPKATKKGGRRKSKPAVLTDEDEVEEEEESSIGRQKPSRRSTAASKGRRRKHTKLATPDDETEESETEEEETEAYLPKTQSPKSFPAVITTYEMIIKDRQFLANYNWGYIVVDEGHRLKNFDCKLMQEIKKYESAGRMILTGTPLHVSIRHNF